jgi:hypothetical protein
MPSLRDSVPFCVAYPRTEVPSTSSGQALGYYLSPLRGLVVFRFARPTACAPSTSLRAGFRGFGLRELGLRGIPEMGILADLFWAKGSFVASSVP